MRTSVGRIDDETARKILEAGGVFRPFTETVSEKDFQRAIIDTAIRNGWLYYHTRDSRKSPAGFPDLVLVRERVLWLEVKTETGQASASQLDWRDALLAAGQDYRLVRPSDWQSIRAALEGR